MSNASATFRCCLLILSLCAWTGCQTGYEAQKLPILGIEHVGEAVSEGEAVRLNLLPPEEVEGALVTRLAVLNLGSAPMEILAVHLEGPVAKILEVTWEAGGGALEPRRTKDATRQTTASSQMLPSSGERCSVKARSTANSTHAK